MKRISLNKISIYKFDLLSGFDSILHFSTCKNQTGNQKFSMSLSSVNWVEPIIENRKILATELNLQPENFVFQQQEHTNNVTIVKNGDHGKGFYKHIEGFANNDAMITKQKNICLMIMGADCVPVLLFDPIKNVIGAVHAGWKGTAKKIVCKTILTMMKEFESLPSDIIAGIGPSISAKNYEVDTFVYEKFAKKINYVDRLFSNKKEKGKYLLDLREANKLQLLSSGVLEKHIEVAKKCTFENNESFFSARKGESGRFACGILIKP